MKLFTSLLVLCLAISIGCSLAQTDMDGNTSNTDNMSMMNNVTGNMCNITGIMILTPANMTGSQAGDMTGNQTYGINATITCMLGTMNNMTGGQAGNMTGDQTRMAGDQAGGNMTGMENMTAKTCYLTGNATALPTEMTMAENMTVDNMTSAQNYSIFATVECMPSAMVNMSEGAQAENMTGMGDNITGMNNMTGVGMCDIKGIMTLIPANMTQTGNMTDIGNIPGAQTYLINATVECMPVVMSNMTEGAHGNTTENMTDMENMTEIKMCFISGNATYVPADMIQAGNITDVGNMTGDQTHSLTAAVDVECMPGAMVDMTGNMVNITGVPQEKNIIETAEDAGNFTTLLTALNAANLTDTLKGDGPFTVFAPTDKSFSSLPAGTIEALLNDTSTLKKILLYHVAGQELMAKDVVNMSNITTLEGRELPVNVTEEGVFVGNAKIIMADINASNGVIHAIDAVLIPPEAEGQTAANVTETQAGNMTAEDQTGTTA